MQGQITSLNDRNSEVSASIASVHSEEGKASDEDSTLHDTINSKKRDRSPSPDDTEDDPSYRLTLAAVRSLLELTIPDEFPEQPSHIFGSKLKDKHKSSLLPMAMSYVHFFLNTIEKMTTKLETTMLGVKNSTRDQSVIKELDSMLSGMQLQFSCISSTEKALENVTDNSIAEAKNSTL